MDEAKMRGWFLTILSFVAMGAIPIAARAADASSAALDAKFNSTVRPLLQKYCVTCHGKDKDNSEGDLDLESYTSMAEAARDSSRWDGIIDKLQAAKMPPKKAKVHPADDQRQMILE